MMVIPEVGEACELPDLRLHLSDPVEPAADNSLVTAFVWRTIVPIAMMYTDVTIGEL